MQLSSDKQVVLPKQVASKLEGGRANKRTGKKLLFFSVVLLSLALIAEALFLSLPSFRVGMQSWPEYLNMTWAHQENLIRDLVDFALKVWLSASALFFGGWLLNRSVRKLRDKSWRLKAANTKRGKFFPPIMLYLKLSCSYLVVIFMFIVLQYPLQFML